MRDKIDLFNTRMYLYNKLIEYEKKQSDKIKSIVEEILAFSYSNDEDIIDIVILDSDNNIIASKLKNVTRDNLFIENIREASKITHRTQLLFIDNKITPQLYISAPIFKDNKLIGTSIFIIQLTYLNKILTKSRGLGKTGEIFMGTNNDKNFILFTPLKFSASPLLSTNTYLNDYISQKTAKYTLNNAMHRTIEKALDYRKVPVVLSMHYNKTLKAVIVVKKDIKELMEPIEKIKEYQLIILLVSVIFIILTSLLISHSMIKVIKNIVRITSNISNGKLKERIEISTKDELSLLATSVNKMADFMVNAHAISEAKVISQTKLLRESNDKLKQISLRLEESVLELQQNNQNLSAIIKSLSHDIKTPLTIIDGYLEELEDGLVECEEVPKVTAILKKETAYLNELSSEVIGYIQSKEIVTNKKERIFLKDFLHAELSSLLRIDEKIELKYEIADHDTIVFNRMALKKILVNLLHNAIKYTNQGSITIKVENENIVIEDTGIGIDPQFSQSIFEPFSRLDESRNRTKGGFGLGLSIANNLAQKNGYKLYLDESYTNGCRFVLEKLMDDQNTKNNER